MARDMFGNRKVSRGLYTPKMVTDADIRNGYFKMVFYILAGYLYFHFIVMGWSLLND